MYCQKSFQDDDINRFKKHLAGVRGDVGSCKKVSPDVRYQMQKNLNEIGNKKWRLNEADEEVNSDEDLTSQNLNIEVEEILNLSAPSNSKGQGNAFSRDQLHASNKRLESVTKIIKFGSDNYFMPKTTTGAQPSLKSVLQTKKIKEKIDLVVSKWMIDVRMPFNAYN
jgi:hypothetical protein